MITFNSVSKEVGKGRLKRLVLEDVNWSISPRSQILILGQSGSGKSTLLQLLAGLTTPTHGWIDRRATVSIPTGLLRYGAHDTPRKLIFRLSQIYNVDPNEIIAVTALVTTISHLLDVPIRSFRGALRAQLSVTLTYAFPCDFYLFDGALSVGRDQAFRSFCESAFRIRKKQAGTIMASSSVKTARAFGGDAAGAVLFRNKLYVYPDVEHAVVAFERLPPEKILPPPLFIEPEKVLDADDGF